MLKKDFFFHSNKNKQQFVLSAFAEAGKEFKPLGEQTTPRKIRWGCAARIPKLLPYL